MALVKFTRRAAIYASSTPPKAVSPTQKRVTLADVARHAGVTTMTVSRFLRTPEQVAPSTAVRVLAALERTGYVANKQAGILATGTSSMVAAIIPNITHSIFSETIQGLSDSLETHGFELLLASSGYSLEREQKQIRAVLGWAPFALVLTGRHHAPGSQQLLQAAHVAGTPVVEMWDHSPSQPEFAHIGFDHAAAGALMAQHLVSRDYQDLVYVDSGVAEDFRAHERGKGFAQTAASLGAGASRIQAALGDPIAAGRKVLQNLLRTTRLPRAIAFANDQLAVGALLEAIDQHIAVPERLALLGFGDFPMAAQVGGGLSTVATPCYEIGQAVGQWIATCRPEFIKSSPPLQTVAASRLRPSLIHRRTT